MTTPNQANLRAMELVEAFSKRLNTISWVWGGFTVDIYENRVLRQHDDIDYLTLNLHRLLPQFSELFFQCGWQVKVLENGDLRLNQEGIKIHLGHVEVSDNARWTHNGEKGSIWFPARWLRFTPVRFCGFDVHVVEPEFQLVLLEHPEMLNPNWTCREKDILALRYFRRLAENRGISSQTLFEQVHSIDSYRLSQK